MTKYVALLRGVTPMNPNMRNEKLRAVMEDLGFTGVQTVISSGNVIFESPETDSKKLETLIEQAWSEKLGFASTTIIRSQRQLQQLVAQRPFGSIEHSQKQNLTVTFLKDMSRTTLPSRIDPRGYELVGLYNGAILSIVDLTSAKTPNLMAWLERQCGKHITTRTWKTVQRILSKME